MRGLELDDEPSADVAGISDGWLHGAGTGQALVVIGGVLGTVAVNLPTLTVAGALVAATTAVWWVGATSACRHTLVIARCTVVSSPGQG
jgi:hypothetical protein